MTRLGPEEIAERRRVLLELLESKREPLTRGEVVEVARARSAYRTRVTGRLPWTVQTDLRALAQAGRVEQRRAAANCEHRWAAKGGDHGQ